MKYWKKYLLHLFIFTVLFLTAGNKIYAKGATIDSKLADDFVVILDVSGSMKETDSERLAFESIELFMNLCDDEDRLGVIAFNEDIVYQSKLVKGNDQDAIRDIKNQLSKVTYQGDTDNGLGLKAGVSMLAAQSIAKAQKISIIRLGYVRLILE